jgi:hypothetical protein
MGKHVFVLDKDAEQNRVTLGDEDGLFRTRVTVTGLNFISGHTADPEKTYTAKLRYAHRPAAAKLTIDGNTAVLTFDEPIFKPVCIIYAAIISVMTGKAFGLFLSKKTVFTGIVFSGSFLFFLSDLMLVLKLFADIGNWPYHACITLYYPSVCLLALSMLIKVMEKKGAQT